MPGWDGNTEADTGYFTNLGNGRYRLRRDTVWGGNYLSEGDLFRMDEPLEQELLAAPAVLRGLMRPPRPLDERPAHGRKQPREIRRRGLALF